MTNPRKPFKRTKVGKVLTSPLFKNLVTLIPFGIGSAAEKVLTKTEREVGTMSREEAVRAALKIIIYLGLALAFLKGCITGEEVDAAKDILEL